MNNNEKKHYNGNTVPLDFILNDLIAVRSKKSQNVECNNDHSQSLKKLFSVHTFALGLIVYGIFCLRQKYKKIKLLKGL